MNPGEKNTVRENTETWRCYKEEREKKRIGRKKENYDTQKERARRIHRRRDRESEKQPELQT